VRSIDHAAARQTGTLMPANGKNAIVERRINSIFYGGLGHVKFDIPGRERITLDDLSKCGERIVYDMLRRIKVLLLAGLNTEDSIEAGIQAVVREPSLHLYDSRVECGTIVRQLLGNGEVKGRLENAVCQVRHPAGGSRGRLTKV
jgi:hypothetical protein